MSLRDRTTVDWQKAEAIRQDILISTKDGKKYPVDILYQDEDSCIMRRIDTGTIITCQSNKVLQ